MFSFEKLDVYKRSLELVNRCEGLCRELKGKVSYSMLDQLSRAVMSVPLNIAEGNGRWHHKDKRNFFWIAQGSVFEIVPLIQILKTRELIDEENYKTWYADLEALAKMMTRLAQSVDKLENRIGQTQISH